MGKRLADAFDELEARRWPDGPECAYCNSLNVTKMEGACHTAGALICNSCRQQFTVTTNTLLHRTKVPLETWLRMAELINKEKASILCAQQELGITYKTAWRMAQIVKVEPLFQE